MKTIIKFIKNVGPYTPGDRAGFDEDEANVYIGQGAAEVDVPAREVPSQVFAQEDETKTARKARAK